ncbi:uncharacterized protein BDZ83DRAFT_614205, partial [Colletotrichum acutatum]
MQSGEAKESSSELQTGRETRRTEKEGFLRRVSSQGKKRRERRCQWNTLDTGQDRTRRRIERDGKQRGQAEEALVQCLCFFNSFVQLAATLPSPPAARDPWDFHPLL